MSESSHAGRVAVVGSERAVPLDARRTGEPNPATRTTVTIVLRAQTSSARAAASLAPLAAAHREYLTREAFAVEHGATAQDALEVQRFAVDAGLLVLETNLARRSVVVEGTLAALSAAFGTELHLYQTGNGQFRGRVGELWIPRSLDGIVTGVFGLDERPQARAQFRRAVRPAATADVSYAPTTVAAAYQFPKSSTGAGQTVALIELGGGYVQADLNTYFAGRGGAAPSVTSVAVDGASTAAGGDSNADTEVMLDIEVVG
ncbi:MAG: peptidase S53, partial [Candidatus Eremiobacteraeota bacterium]|nr:peptidase S53 [Candidatus Eremiobacteraeota bacterium]